MSATDDKRDQKNPRTNGKPSAKDKKRASNDIPFHGYLNCPLTEADKQDFGKYETDPEGFEAQWASMLEEDFKVTQYFDRQNDAFVASAFCRDLDDAACGYSLSMRGSTPTKALMRLVFVHNVVLQGDWSQLIKPKYNDDQW